MRCVPVRLPFSLSFIYLCCYQSSTGQKYATEVDTDKTIAEFKEALATLTAIPAAQQRLIYKGRVLKDEQTVDSYGTPAFLLLISFRLVAILNLLHPFSVKEWKQTIRFTLFEVGEARRPHQRRRLRQLRHLPLTRLQRWEVPALELERAPIPSQL